ncbi:MAG: ATP-binding cassette domain-containing protein [Nitrospirae bacterium]|nr:ATP-binding cassette domain-containing protein [Nitrospirota bacterium]
MSLGLNAINICKSYNGRSVLKDCSVSLDSGGIYTLMGANGSGKSTFLRICALLEQPDKGEINYLSDPPFCPPLSEVESRGESTGRVTSENTILRNDMGLKRRMTLVLPGVGIFNTTVLKNVAYGLKIRGINSPAAEEKADKALEFVGLLHKKNHAALTLSSGEAQRLGIARAIVIGPEVLFLDEPTASVDQENTEIIEDIILNLRKDKMTTVIIATHDISQAERLAGAALVMRNGKITGKAF